MNKNKPQVGYLVKEGFRNIGSNWLMSLSSVVVLMSCLFLTGTIILFSLNINSTLKTVEENSNVVIYIDTDANEESLNNIEKSIKEIPNIEKCEFHSKDQLLEKYKNIAPAVGRLLGEDNPLPDSFHVSMRDLSQYEQTADQIQAISGVNSMSKHERVAKKLTELNRMALIIEISVIIIFGLVSLFIIFNTTQMSTYSRRQQIGIMKAVGATNAFIRIPFVVEGVVIGIASAMGAIGLLKIISELLASFLKDFLPFMKSFVGINLDITLMFLAVGVFCGLVGGSMSIGRYLRREGGKAIE